MVPITVLAIMQAERDKRQQNEQDANQRQKVAPEDPAFGLAHVVSDHAQDDSTAPAIPDV